MSDCMTTAQSLGEWFAGAQGGYVLPCEQAYFDGAVNDIFGYNALQLGLPEHDFLRNSRIPHRFSGAAHHADVRLCGAELPFGCNSLDMVLMPHVLDFAEHPHPILREVERVLRPEGSVLISGFNPRSLWGLHRALGRRHGYPWCGHFISMPRLKDWLALLGFEVAEVRFVAYAPPFRQKKWLERGQFLESLGRRWWPGAGGVYFVHAIKRVTGLRLLRPQWKPGLVNALLPVAPKLNKPVSRCAGRQSTKDEWDGQSLKHE